MDTSRDAVVNLLPWYETGRLSEDERAAVHDLLAHDLDANRQRRELRTLRAAIAGEPLLEGHVAAGLERFRAQLGADAAPAPRRAPAPLWLAAAATVAVAVGVAAFVAGERAGRYRTLTSAPPAVAPSAARERLRVSVTNGVDAKALLEAAGDADVAIDGAISAQGVATLSVP